MDQKMWTKTLAGEATRHDNIIQIDINDKKIRQEQRGGGTPGVSAVNEWLSIMGWDSDQSGFATCSHKAHTKGI